MFGVVAATTLTACGGGQRQDANEPSGTFAVEVLQASFPGQQRLAQHSQLVIAVRNTGTKAIPDIAVTLTDPKLGTAVQPFGQQISGTGLASTSRPAWVVDKPPGRCGYSCRAGGPGAAVTAYSNTWALGRLAPGQTATFTWAVTAVAPGTRSIEYQVAAGLNGKAKARLQGGGLPHGMLTVKITGRPAVSYVSNSGQIVTAH